MADRVVVVTGAGNGLGAAFARACAENGARVVVNNRTHADRPSSAAATVDALQADGYAAVADEHPIDAAGAAQAIVETALDALGQLDAIILNAGISGPASKVGDTPDAVLREVLEINFFANASLVNAALPHLLGSPAGRIVLIASSAGLHGVRGRAPYAASKGALIAYGRSLADELKLTNVRVNMLAPYAATKMTVEEGGATDPRLSPDNSAAAAAWLASPECTTTGEIWLAGADWFRRAAVVEGDGGGRPHADAAWLTENADRIRGLEPHREFTGAESAFADFYKAATAGNRD